MREVISHRPRRFTTLQFHLTSRSCSSRMVALPAVSIVYGGLAASSSLMSVFLKILFTDTVARTAGTMLCMTRILSGLDRDLATCSSTQHASNGKTYAWFLLPARMLHSAIVSFVYT